MKKKYQITLVVIGCLIVLIGLSYAYFVATSTGGGPGGNVVVNTYTIDNIGFNVEGKLEFDDLDIYPGHKNIAKIKVDAIGNDDIINYKLVWEGINTLNTPLKYYVYRTVEDKEASITCKKEIEQVGASKIYYETCSEENVDSLGPVIKTGEITKAEASTEFVLANDEVIKGTKDGNTIYYYVILEYPNLNESQNIDMGGTFEGKLTVKKEEDTTVDINIKKIYQETETGYEEINKMPNEGYVLNSEKSSCTNNATPVPKGSKILITNLTTSNTECNIYFDKDKEKPVITNIIPVVAKNSITVTVEATDNVGITEYWYQIDSNTPVKGTTNTYTFTGLTAGATYSVKVYVKDAAGNQSDTSTKSVTTLPPTASETILGNITYNTTQPNFGQTATTDEGVYRVEDGMYGGYSYYWRGAVTNNYVKFADKCWRIVRINGDGSIRLIYDGTTCHANGTNADSIAVASTTYNTSYNNSSYVGWTYTASSQRPTSTTSGTASNAKTQLESWYSSNITGTNATKVADGKYCNDRTSITSSGGNYTWAATGSTFYYGAYHRINTGAPTLSCPNGDIYSLKVGLITADEVMYAGGKVASNTSYYLYNGQNYWTMSPHSWSGGAVVFFVNLSGVLSYYGANGTRSLRPVINLNADVTFSGGNGTQSNPYIVQ